MNCEHEIWLASASPRRKLLLERAGYTVRVQAPAVDDGLLKPGSVSAREWVMALANLKAESVSRELETRNAAGRRLIVAADTVCVLQGAILGQPRDARHAREMLMTLREAVHEVHTGVCIVTADRRLRRHFVDSAVVRLGRLTEPDIDQYVDSELWRGKAGAYNLEDRLAAGWPISFTGDPTTIMGLPMQKLPGWIACSLSVPPPASVGQAGL